MKKTKLLVGAASLAMLLTACGGSDTPVEPLPQGTDTGVIAQDVVEHKSTESVYEKIGAGLTIDKVTEEKSGLAYATVDGVKYELGMDFLSMAMVYNVKVPENSTKYKTAEDVYNQWWKLYIQRWNSLMPEVPLYSNQYFDLYAMKLDNFKTSPYWGAADAINVTTSTDGKVILGNGTDLAGGFRAPAWGKSSASAADIDVAGLCSGYSTVMTTFDGSYAWNMYDSKTGLGVLAEEPSLTTTDADGNLVIRVKIQQGLKFSDGSDIKAANYIVGILSNSTAVGKEAGGTGNSGNTLVGFAEFKAGAENGTAFKGVKLIDDYTFEVLYTPDYAGYYYSIAYAGFSPDPLGLYLGTATDAIKTNANKECYLDSSFFAKGLDGKYTHATEIKNNMKWNSNLPYSGPFKVKSYDEAAKTAILERNEVYPGDVFRGTKPAKNSIDEIAYIKVEDETQMSKFEAGEVDVIAAITGGEETDKALALVKAKKAKETHYDRAGYGKLAFRCDYGPTLFASVRRAITYSINRPKFANTFTGGYGTVVDGPYYEGASSYKAVKRSIKLNKYTASTKSAIKELVAGGWVYDAQGQPYKGEGIRYKKLTGYEKTTANLSFKSLDNKYQTVFVNGNWLMPLAINYIGTQPNPVTDLLLTDWAELASSNAEIGMYIKNTNTDFTTAVYGEYSLYEGYFDGTQKCNAVNFATGFNSATYDFSFNWSIDPAWLDYSNDYLFDEADYAENYVKAA